MDTIALFLKRAAEKTGFHRSFYVEKKIPTTLDNIVLLIFFGDYSSMVSLSTFILNRYKEMHKDKYLILCSWDGWQGMFPGVDEYWTIVDNSGVNELAINANNFYNNSQLYTTYKRNLLQYFGNVLGDEDIAKYCENGFTAEYMKSFGDIKRFRPGIPSLEKASTVDIDRRKGDKVVIFPAKRIRSWQRGKVEYINIGKEFWKALCQRLIDEGITPVVFQNNFTHDVSPDFADKCAYVVSKNILQVLGVMRHIGCVVDVFSGISRLAIAARCPFVCVDERARFHYTKDYEIDDLCCEKMPRHYVFSFSTMLLTGTVEDWNNSVVNQLIGQIKTFLPTLTTGLEDANQSEVMVDYGKVRDRKFKRMGIRFIKKY